MKDHEHEAHRIGLINHQLLGIERSRKELWHRKQALISERQICIDRIGSMSTESATRDIPLKFTELVADNGPSIVDVTEVVRLELVEPASTLPKLSAEAA